VESYESTDPDQLIWGTQFHPERLTGAQWDERTPDFAEYFAVGYLVGVLAFAKCHHLYERFL